MGGGTRLGLLALAAAVMLGLLGDLLLRALPWGLNAPLWIVALLIVAALLLRQARLLLLGEARWLALPSLLFAAGIAWRDSPALLTVNLLAVALTLGLAAHRAPDGWPRLGGLPQYVGALLSAGVHACGGVLVLAFHDIHWRDVPRTGRSASLLAVLRGLIIAIPLLLLFGALLMAADAVFSGLVSGMLTVDVREVFSHLFWLLVWTWLTAGFLRQALFCTIAIDGLGGSQTAPASPAGTTTDAAAVHEAPTDAADVGSRFIVPDPAPVPDSIPAPASTPAPVRLPHSAPIGARFMPPAGGEVASSRRLGVLGIVELGVVLGLLDLLFLAFVIVQFRYLFGGAELVQVSPSLTYAEYARRGFFELVAVAALLLGIMLLLDWLAKLDGPRQATVYRALAGLLVALLFVVIVSALQRMRLYTAEYGLTELRLYTTAFMLWITAGAVWYLATVLRDHRERFLFGALMAGLVVAAVLDAIDPDNLIIRTNAARQDAADRFDGSYTLLLSADATPAVIEAFQYIPSYQQTDVARRLLERWERARAEDWRSWNYGRWRAFQATAANEALLREAARQPDTRPTVPPGRSGSQGSRGGRLDVPGPNDRP